MPSAEIVTRPSCQVLDNNHESLLLFFLYQEFQTESTWSKTQKDPILKYSKNVLAQYYNLLDIWSIVWNEIPDEKLHDLEQQIDLPWDKIFLQIQVMEDIGDRWI